MSHKISIEPSDRSTNGTSEARSIGRDGATGAAGMTTGAAANGTSGAGAMAEVGATTAAAVNGTSGASPMAVGEAAVNGTSEAGPRAVGEAALNGTAGAGRDGMTSGAALNGTSEAAATEVREAAATAVHEPVPDDRESAPGDRDGVAAALDELSGWGPKDRHWMFQRWHRGALSLVHLNVLAALESEGSLSMSHLADTLDVSVASATGIVDRMERRGLVERRHDTADRRVVLVLLTPAGADIFRDLASHRREHLTRLLRELSEDDLAAFVRSLRALKAARMRLAAGDLERGAFEPSEPSDPDGSPDR